MAFNTEANIRYTTNPALEVAKGPIPMDGSSLNEVTTKNQTTTAMVNQGPGEPMAFNGVEVLFDVRPPSNARVMFDKSYIKIDGFAANMAVNADAPVLDGASIPWNSIAALIRTAEIKMNQSATTTELLVQNVGDGSMVKMLTRYTRTALESMEDSMFTPCFEETRDLNTGVAGGGGHVALSQVSQLRRNTQLVDPIGNTQRKHSKNIYLSDLFDSVRIPAAFYLNNLQLRIRPNLTSDILIKDTGRMGVNADLQKYFVTGMTLYLTYVTLSDEQLKLEAERILKNPAMMLQTFYAYDALQRVHQQGVTHRDTNVKNLQACVALFPSSLAGDGIGANRYQYCYGSGVGGVTGITTYQMRYGQVYSPAQPVNVSQTNHATNTEMYAQYRLLSRKMWEREVDIPVRFTDMAPSRPTLDDPSYYTMFCAQFFPLTAHGHATLNGGDHEVIFSGGAANAEPVVIVRIRLSFLEIRGDSSVYVIN